MHPILFRIPGLGVPIFSYGFMIMVGFICAITYASWRARTDGHDPNDVLDLGVLMVISGVLGSRVFYVAQFWHVFADQPWWKVFAIWEGGIVFYGGLIVAAITGLIFLRVRELPVLEMADICTPAIPIGLGFGRIGCFLNGCCWGKLCDASAWYGVQFPRLEADGQVTGSLAFLQHARPEWAASQEVAPLAAGDLWSYPVFPTQLMSASLAFLLALALALFYLKRRRVGQTFALLWIIYPIQRIGLEFFRGDTIVQPGAREVSWLPWVETLTISQQVGLAIIPVGVGFFIWSSLRGTPVSELDGGDGNGAREADDRPA